MSAPLISARNLSRVFDKVAAVDDVSFEVRENEFFSLLGPSGCGKTTLLRMIAGLEVPSAGQLLIGGEDMARRPPNKRPVNMVFQSYAVFPHMSVAENVGYGLMVSGEKPAQIAPRVRQALEMVRMDTFANRRPDQLSGGQRQRVALARALVKQPRVLLLDEPMSALDAKLREQMQTELTRLQKAVGITFIMVTHDQQEALSMSDRIAVMDAGRISQLAPPRELYEAPANRFVAGFIGKINLLDATVTGSDASGTDVELNELGPMRLPGLQHETGPVTVAIRPEHLSLAARGASPCPAGCFELPVSLLDQAFLGDSTQLTVQTVNEIRLLVTARRESQDAATSADASQEFIVRWPLEHCRLLPA